MIIITSRHNLLSACSSCKTWLQSHPSGEQMVSPGSLPLCAPAGWRPRAVLLCLHGCLLSCRLQSQAGRSLAGSWGNAWPRCVGKETERDARGSQQLPSQAGIPEFYYRVLICSTAPEGHSGQVRRGSCALSVCGGLGVSFCSPIGLRVGMSAQDPHCDLDLGGNLAARRPGHLPPRPTFRSLILWLFRNVPTLPMFSWFCELTGERCLFVCNQMNLSRLKTIFPGFFFFFLSR